MENEVIGLIGVASLMIMIVLHVPIGVSMAVAGTVTFAFLRNWNAAFSVVGTEATTAIASPDLALIPLFILMGNFAAGGGMARDIYRLAFTLVGHMRGGLAMATIGGCAGFGAVSGSSIATVTTMTKVAYPEMTKRGYSQRLAGGSIAAGGTLGMLVPPSIIFVLYGVLTENFVLTLFAAAIVPATLAVIMHFIAIQIYLRISPDAGRPAERTNWVGRLQALRNAWTVLFLAFVVAGGIYSGIFTVTESAAVGAVLAMAIAILRGELSMRSFWAALHDTAATTAMIYVIVIGAGVFSYAMTLSLLPETLVNWIGGLPVPPLVIIGILMIFYIFIGAIFDTISAMVLTLPFVYPVILQLGYDPIWWGVIMIMVIEIGMITPPIGINVLVMNAMLPNVSLGTIYRGIVPFLCADLIRLVILILIPALSLFLPTLMDMPR